MRPPNRNRRLLTIAVVGVALASGVTLLLSALNANTQFFYEPSTVVAPNFEAGSEQIRIGGLVTMGSIERGEGLLTRFSVTDFEDADGPQLDIEYEGVMPDLFREGQGVVVTGIWSSSLESRGGANILLATEVLAKHDENYRPKLDTTPKS